MLQAIITIVVSPNMRKRFEDDDLKNLAFEVTGDTFLPPNYTITTITVCFAVEESQPDHLLTIRFAFFKLPQRRIIQSQLEEYINKWVPLRVMDLARRRRIKDVELEQHLTGIFDAHVL